MSAEESRGFPSKEWVKRMASLEDEHPWFGVGGLAGDAGLLKSASGEVTPELMDALDDERGAGRIVFARFLDLARRSLGLSLDRFAEEAAVDLEELVQVIEDHASPKPRTVFQIAKRLDVSPERLMELAGLIEPREETLEAGLRFAARSEATAQLSAEERVAFEEFVKVLVEKTDGER